MKLKKEINYLGIGSNNEAMRSFRNDIINLKKENHRSIFSLGDFYSLSEWRDLLFHIKEHHFTLPQIRTCLDELGLFFCGFESDKIVQKFKLNNSDANDPYNLEKWNTFELSNPQSFSEMYQFWCQKVI